MTALSSAIDVGIIEDGLVAANLAACLVQDGIDCGRAIEKASRPTARLRGASPGRTTPTTSSGGLLTAPRGSRQCSGV